MRRGRSKIAILPIIAMLALLSSTIYAYSNDADTKREKMSESEWNLRQQDLYKDLKITDDQKKLLEENRNKHREQMKAMANEMKEKRSSIRQEIQKETLNMEKIAQINNEIKKLDAQMLDYRLERILEVRKVLTPEQFKKFMEKIEKRKKEYFRSKRD